MNDQPQKESIHWHKVFRHNFSELNIKEKIIRIILFCIAAYFIGSWLFMSGDMEFIYVSGTGEHGQFVLEEEYVEIIQKAVNNETLNEQEKETLKNNVPRKHAEIAYSVLRNDWYTSQGLEGFQTTMASNAQAEEFVNDVYGYVWQY